MSVIAKKKIKRFTVDQYFEMDDAGAFGDHRVELILGRVYRVNAQNSSHRRVLSRVTRRLMNFFPEEKFWVIGQGTLPLGKFGAPDPDAYVLDVPTETPEHRIPLPFIVIEVADTTYRRDSGVKQQQYAAAGVQDYWIVNISRQQIEVFRQPVGMTSEGFAGFAERVVLKAGEAAKSLRFPDFALRVDELF